MDSSLCGTGEVMKLAYADPPYLGCCKLYKHNHELPYGCWDDLATHHQLIDWLETEFHDGWAMSTTSVALRPLLPLCPSDTRVAAWVKPFHAYKKGVRPAYSWEPVIFRGGRQKAVAPPKGGTASTPKDHLAENIVLKAGFTGAKPRRFVLWVLDLLGATHDDEIVDVFPGSGAVTAAIESWRGQPHAQQPSLWEAS